MKVSSLEAIAGGLAVTAHGYGRLTFDIDLVLQLQPDNVDRAMVALESLGYRPTVPVPARQFADPVIRSSWVREKNMVVFQMHSDRHPETRIDLFVEEPFDFDVEYGRALEGEIAPGLTVRFVDIDALVRMKQVAARPKDLEDIRQLRKLQADSPND